MKPKHKKVVKIWGILKNRNKIPILCTDKSVAIKIADRSKSQCIPVEIHYTLPIKPKKNNDRK